MTQSRPGLFVTVFRLIRPLFSSRASLIESMSRERTALRTAVEGSSSQISASPLAAFADEDSEPEWDKIVVFCRLTAAWHLFWFVIAPLVWLAGVWYLITTFITPTEPPPGGEAWVEIVKRVFGAILGSAFHLAIGFLVCVWFQSLLFAAYARFVGRLVRLPMKMSR